MNVNGGSSSSSGVADEANSGRVRRALSNALYHFTQQSLPACKPVLTPASVITAFFLIGILFIPIGFFALQASMSVVEIVDRYDIHCIPEPYKRKSIEYIKDNSISKNCTRYLKVPKAMKAPIYVYYELDHFYQNHRRYVKSRNDAQLLNGLKTHDIKTCEPEEFNNGQPIIPCGLIAWSLFNDTFSFSRVTDEIKLNRKNISWKSDREHKFGKQVYPSNFQNGSLIGGAKLDTTIPLSEQEDLMVWMRPAALPKFRKLYGRIEEDLKIDDVIIVNLMNNYNTYSFDGTKKLVLSTTSWLGGRNNFLGMAYIIVGASFIFIALVFILLHVTIPRYVKWEL